MKIREITGYLNAIAPPALAESYDNPGLLTGDGDREASGVLVNLDVTEAVIDEAIDKGINLIVAHHPLIFSAMKKLSGKDYVSRALVKAIRNDIAIYAIHTNLDNIHTGVNRKICDLMGLQNQKVLRKKSGLGRKLVVFVPQADTDDVASALFSAGAGKIGNYSEASFFSEGTGTFLPEEGANPAIGTVGNREKVSEHKLEVVFPAHLQSQVLKALMDVHPYETPAFDIFESDVEIEEFGAGMIGELETAMDKPAFLKMLKARFGCGCIRWADADAVSMVKRVAVCGGSGSFLTGDALRAGADAFVTGDITYHKFFDSESKMLLCDIGHYESEQFTSDLLKDLLSEKFPNFAVRLSEVVTNPVKYF